MARANNRPSIEQSWEILFDRHDILQRVEQDGIFRISSDEINTVREARLMAKFDQSAQLPEIFRKNNLSILPVTRGEYIIGPFETHLDIAYSDEAPQPVKIPDLQTLDYTNLYSEASALLFAYNSGIIHDVMDAEKIHFTVNGRMASGNFSYTIRNRTNPRESIPVAVQNAQVEIDAGYESPEAFCICEAKNIAAEEILIRQLYYPYRLWTSKIAKPVVPVFLVYSNDIFHTFKFTFDDIHHYNSLRLIERKSYTFADEAVTLNEVIDLWRRITPEPEPEVTFPQADSFARVVDLLSILYERDLSRDEVTLNYEFRDRQTNYYIDACRYLSFVEKYRSEDGEVMYTLTSQARAIMALRYKMKYMALIRKVLSLPVFHRAFEIVLRRGETPSKPEICSIMEESRLGINPTTIERRSSTVRGWIEWILRQAKG